MNNRAASSAVYFPGLQPALFTPPTAGFIICIPLIPAAWFDKLTILRRTISSSLSLRAEGLSMVEGRGGVFAGR